MKRTIPAVLIAAALALAGCSSTAPGQAGTAAGAALPTATATASPAPIVLDSPKPTATPSAGPDEALFLRAMAGTMNPMPSDADLLAAGYLACKGMDEGGDHNSIVVVTNADGTVSDTNGTLIRAASQYLCPEHVDDF